MSTISKRQLVDALKTVAPAIPKVTGLPILYGARIADGQLTASNLDLTISTQLDVDLDVVVPHAVLSRIAGSLTDGEVTLTVDGDKLAICQGSTAASIQLLVGVDWPQLQLPEGDGVTLSDEDVRSLGRIIHALAPDGNPRPWTTAVHLNGKSAEASDSYQLARIDLSADVGEALVPAPILRRVVSAGEGVEVMTDGTGIRFVGTNTSWASRLVVSDSGYPNFGRLLAEDKPHQLDVGVDDLCDTLERLASLGPLDEKSAHRLSVVGDTLHVTRKVRDVGEMAESIDCSGDWCGDTALAGPLVIEAVRNADVDTVTLGTAAPNRGVRIDGADGYVSIVMPVTGSGS